MDEHADGRTLTIVEPRRVPLDSLVFGWVAMVPFAGGALGAVLFDEAAPVFSLLTVLWGSAILTFLAGVRRGVSFRTPEGPTGRQLALMFTHFVLGALAMLVVAVGIGAAGLAPSGLAAALLIAGYVTLAIFDPLGAEAGTMPLHFRRLRPVQMLIPILSLAVILAAPFL